MEVFSMTPKEKEYVLEYLANGYNAQKAYQKVYNKPEGSRNGYAYDILRKPEIKAFISEYRKKRMEAFNIDNDRIIEKLLEIAFSDKDDKYYKSVDKLKALDMLRGMLSSSGDNDEMIIKVEIDDKGNIK